MTQTIRCRNWEDDPETCGETCGIEVEASTYDYFHASLWMDAVMGTPEWFIVLRSCPEPDHDQHADPFCSLQCFINFHERHNHPT